MKKFKGLGSFIERHYFKFSFTIFFLVIICFSLFGKKPTIVSSVTYGENSNIQPVYTFYKEGTNDFNKVVSDLDYYTTKPDSSKITLKSAITGSNVSSNVSSIYYQLDKGISSPFTFVSNVFSESESSIILYNRKDRTYEVKKVSDIEFVTDTKSKDDLDSYYRENYGGYNGMPSPKFSHTSRVEIITYSDRTIKWVYSEKWKLDNEDELKAYLSSTPKKKE